MIEVIEGECSASWDVGHTQISISDGNVIIVQGKLMIIKRNNKPGARSFAAWVRDGVQLKRKGS